MSPIELKANEVGNARPCPITDFQVQLASNEMVIITVQYVETIEQFDSGQWKQLQTVLPAKRALEFGATIKKAAKLILESDSSSSLNISPRRVTPTLCSRHPHKWRIGTHDNLE